MIRKVRVFVDKLSPKKGRNRLRGVGVPRGGMLARKLPVLIGNKYKIQHLLGSGSFGAIYSCLNMESGDEFAAKFEHVKARFPQLLFEKRIYEIFQKRCEQLQTKIPSERRISEVGSNGSTTSSCVSSTASNISGTSSIFDYGNTMKFLHEQKTSLVGIPKVHYFGSLKNYNVLVMDRLGPNLEDLFSFCHRCFSLKTVLMLADQIISRLEFVHSQFFIHRDIKPENFLMGVANKICCYIVDFGLAKKYVNEKTRRHIKMRKGKPLTGTARYTSLNSHLGYEQSRRDDLESLGYVLVYFAKRGLPWQGLKAETKEQRYEKIFMKKMCTSPEALCKGLPIEFTKYFQYIKKLKFSEKPDYDYMRRLFFKRFKKEGYVYDFQYDWMLMKKDMHSNDNILKFVDEVSDCSTTTSTGSYCSASSYSTNSTF